MDILEEIKAYWDTHIHDLEIAQHPIGRLEFFKELSQYRFEKLNYLPKVVDFCGFSGKKLLEIGCGLGIDLIQFAKGGAEVTGVDLSSTAIALAKKYFSLENIPGHFKVMNGEALQFPDASFDVVYCHGVLQYTANPEKMIQEAFRVLTPGGMFIGMVYNRKGWLYAFSKWFRVKLEHQDAPVFHVYTEKEFRQMLSCFSSVRIIPERFPVQSKLHQKGIKGFLFNTVFVNGFRLIPKPFIRPWGWHLLAFARK